MGPAGQCPAVESLSKKVVELGSDKAGLGDYLYKVGLSKYISMLRIIDSGRQVSHCQRGELEPRKWEV